MGTALQLERFEAVLCGLDGVLADTSPLHAEAWKLMFDEFLARWSEEHGHPFEPFSIDPDYLQYLDGKPPLEGVASFLESRRIVLPEGGAGDEGPDTIFALSERKSDIYQELLRERGVEPFPGAVRFVGKVRSAGLKTAVVTSSRHAETVLEVTGMADLFDERVDGKTAAELGLAGQPAPDTFLEATRRLGVEPSATVVVEDAIVAIEAARVGGIGFVVGVAREGEPERLERHGADLVVTDLDALVEE